VGVIPGCVIVDECDSVGVDEGSASFEISEAMEVVRVELLVDFDTADVEEGVAERDLVPI
jgi:hypothetical protein